MTLPLLMPEPDLLHPVGQFFLESPMAGLIERRAEQAIGQAGYLGHTFLGIVCVYVTLTKTQTLHQACRGVSQVQGNRRIGPTLHLPAGLPIGPVQGVALG